MNWKSGLILLLVALGGIALGAWGMNHFGSWEGVAQALGVLRQPGSREQAATRAAADKQSERTTKADAPQPGTEPHNHGEEKLVRLPAEQVKQLGIEVALAGSLQTQLTLPGTITLNTDRRVHIVSRIPGVVREIRKTLGDAVQAGDVMAVIDSRELADTKAAYLAARERLSLVENTFAREKDLWEKKISPEQDYLTAKNAMAEARIALQNGATKAAGPGLH